MGIHEKSLENEASIKDSGSFKENRKHSFCLCQCWLFCLLINVLYKNLFHNLPILVKVAWSFLPQMPPHSPFSPLFPAPIQFLLPKMESLSFSSVVSSFSIWFWLVLICWSLLSFSFQSASCDPRGKEVLSWLSLLLLLEYNKRTWLIPFINQQSTIWSFYGN